MTYQAQNLRLILKAKLKLIPEQTMALNNEKMPELVN